MNNQKNSPILQFLKNKPELIKTIKAGDLVEAVLIEKNRQGVYFDLGGWGTGIVYGAEFANAQDILKDLKPGDRVSAKVIEAENEEGYVELSLAGAEKQKIWQNLKELQESGEIITVKVIGANSGGLVTKINEISGFIPISQLAEEHYPKIENEDKIQLIKELQKLMGQELKVKIIDLNPRTNKLILSERESIVENIQELLSRYKVGDVVEGIISGIADFGVFMKFADNPKIEGLIHISEIDHRLITNPKEVVKLNDAVQAKILEIKNGRVWLSIKALKTDPWLKAEEFYKIGQEVSGTVANFNPFGALINLDYSLQGLIHISEFGSVEEMKKQLELDKPQRFIIDQIRPQEKRIILKLKK